MTRRRKASFQVGSKISLHFGGRDVTGSVVEVRGPLAQGEQLLAIQLDGNPRDPYELEVPASMLQPAPMPAERKEALSAFLGGASSEKRFLATTALLMLHEQLNHVAMGLWPDALSRQVSADTGDEWHPGNSEAEEALDELAELGVVARRPSGLFIGTEWLSGYLAENPLDVQWQRPQAHVRRVAG